MRVIFLLLCLVAVSAVVSFALGAFIRSRPITLIGSLFITELLFLILIYRDIASSSDAPEVFLLPVWIAIVIAPIILLTAWACVAFMARFRRGRPSHGDAA
jgi:hypothetical protein